MTVFNRLLKAGILMCLALVFSQKDCIAQMPTIDSSAAKAAMMPGNGSLKVSVKFKGDLRGLSSLAGGYTGSNCTVILYPASAYFNEWMEVTNQVDKAFLKHRKDYDQGRYKELLQRFQTMKKNLNNYARSITTDGYGEGVFNNLKQGKYVLLAYPNGITHSGDGYHSGGTGRWEHWESVSYYRVMAEVDIPAGSQQTKVTMRKSSLIEKQVQTSDFQ